MRSAEVAGVSERRGRERTCDVAVIGAGPAGLTAALYAGRARLSVVVIEKAVPGGQIATTNDIENYPGYRSIGGPDLAARMQEQAEAQGARLETAEVTGVELDGPPAAGDGGGRPLRRVITTAGDVLARSLIIATGSEPRKLGVPGEDRLRGLGVSYCATCDGAFFQDREVVVVGGGDAAFQEGTFLTRYAKRVTIVHRREAFRAQPALVEKARRDPRIAFVLNAVVEEILGDRRVEAVRLRDPRDGRTWEMAAQGVFPYVGHVPNSAFLPPAVARDAQGRVVAGEDTRTGVPGVFAAGDIRPKMLRQITTAVADGSTAAMAAEHYLTGTTTLSY